MRFDVDCKAKASSAKPLKSCMLLVVDYQISSEEHRVCVPFIVQYSSIVLLVFAAHVTTAPAAVAEVVFNFTAIVINRSNCRVSVLLRTCFCMKR